MFLVHGTSYTRGVEIMNTAIIEPNGKFFQGEWDVTSCKEAVYLSNAYALNFAMETSNKKEKLVLVEVDTTKLNPICLMADEDALEQSYRISGGRNFPADLNKMSIEERTFWFSHHLHVAQVLGMNADWSLEANGVCCYIGTIKTEAISRIVMIEDIKDFWWLQFYDSTMSVANHHFSGKQHKIFQKLLMGRVDDAYAESEEGNYAYINWANQIINPHITVVEPS